MSLRSRLWHAHGFAQWQNNGEHLVSEIQTQSSTDRGPKLEPGGPLHERVKDREKPPMPTEKVSSG